MIYARCVRCKKRWNIAIGQRIPKTGYICPIARLPPGAGKICRIQTNVRRINLSGGDLYVETKISAPVRCQLH